MMKYCINAIFMGLAVAASLVFTACGDDPDEPTPTPPSSWPENVQTVEMDVAPEEVGEKELSLEFKSEYAWTITSNQMWCLLREGDKAAFSLTGTGGQHLIYLEIDPEAATDKVQTAVITLTAGGKSVEMAHVNLGAITYHGKLTIDGRDIRSGESEAVDVFEGFETLMLSANYDFHLEMPAWCLVNDDYSFEGKAGEVYPVKFGFNESTGVDKRYALAGELVFASDNVRDVFTIAYPGMDKYVADISLGDDANLTKWNWVVDVENQLYMQSNAQGHVTRREGSIPFTVMCRNDEVQFVHLTQDGDNIEFSTTADYATVTGEQGYYSYSLNEKLPAHGRLMAFSRAAWDTIKSDPVACLMEEGEYGHKTLTYKAYNNVVFEWSKLVTSESPFTVHHLTLWDENGMLAYELSKSSEYKAIFGTDDVWEMSMDPSSVNLCVVMKGYKNEWFASLRMGFDRKLDIPLDDIAENGSCSQGLDGEVPAFSIFMGAEYREMLKQGPFYVAVVNPDTKEVTGLVIKAKQ